MARKSQQDLEKRLDLILLEMAHLQSRKGLIDLRHAGKLNSETQKYISSTTSEIMFWIDECTLAAESPFILLAQNGSTSGKAQEALNVH